MVIGFIVFIAPTTAACEALFFTGARKLHTDCKKPVFDGKAFVRLVSRQLPLRSTATLAALPAMSFVPLAPFAKPTDGHFRSRSENGGEGS